MTAADQRATVDTIEVAIQPLVATRVAAYAIGETLRQIRRLTEAARARDLTSDEAAWLAELVDALDDWITNKGGFLPAEWEN